ncbi:hypothetical protein scyTo_0016104 [Scyliorhinus torazame]|uniref:Histidine ammonia-lyase n=1 Tax=Scyliorhinus torazame TaxID=75743 RepID=A0A401Q424_SCYTO|nr:hypothetical protein [Scyliorhinus torazame]
MQYIYLDGDSLTTEQLVQLGNGSYKIKLTPEVEKKVNKSRDLVEKIIDEGQVVYGINTGLGKFARTVIPHDKLEELQENVVHSTAVGKRENAFVYFHYPVANTAFENCPFPCVLMPLSPHCFNILTNKM